MTFDFHQSSEGVTGQTSPLYPAAYETSTDALQNNIVGPIPFQILNFQIYVIISQKASIAAWLGAATGNINVFGLNFFTSVAATRFNLGIPFYGQTYTLADVTKNGLNVATTGPGSAGQYTGVSGQLTYLELCSDLPNGWTTVYNTAQGVPYAFNNDQWISYDDEQSVQLKVLSNT
jgi:chitinase